MSLDAEGLTKAIKLCFANARDLEHFDAQQRQELVFQGKLLRGHLVNLISAHWEASAQPAVEAANQKIAAVNQRLQSALEASREFAGTVHRLSTLARDLEGLIKVAAHFV